MRIRFQHGQVVEKLPVIQLNAFIFLRPIRNNAFMRRNAPRHLLRRLRLPIRLRHRGYKDRTTFHRHAQRACNGQNTVCRIR